MEDSLTELSNDAKVLYALMLDRASISMEEMKEEIVQDVLSRISAMVDASEIFDAIDGLNEKIESLGR